MPPPRKVDLISADLRKWLQDALIQRGFGDYEALADDLNDKLAENGSEVRIQKSALHAYGSEFREFVRLQEQASDWAKEWLGEMGMDDQAQRHNVLFQMLTTLAFKVMQSEITKEGDAIDPQALHFLARMMKDVMSSSGIMQQMREKERRAATAALEAAAKARRIMGFG